MLSAFLCFWFSAFVHIATASELGDVKVHLPEGTTVIGAKVKGGSPAAKLEAKLDSIPYGKATSMYRFGEMFPDAGTAWKVVVADVVNAAIADEVRADSWVLHIKIQQMTILANDANAAVRLRLQWDLTNAWGTSLVKGSSSARALGPEDELDKMVHDALGAAAKRIPGTMVFQQAMDASLSKSQTLALSKGPLSLARCGSPAASVEDVVKATVVVKSDKGVGAGVRVSDEGYIVTAYHVVHDADVLQVRADGGAYIDAKVVGVAPGYDVAILSYEGEGACVGLEGATATPGMDLYAVGTPAGEALAFSVTRGVLSGVRNLNEDLSLIQTDVPINGGNSGGPLVDKAGHWMGVISFKLVGRGTTGLGFAIPSEVAVRALELDWK